MFAGTDCLKLNALDEIGNGKSTIAMVFPVLEY
jgi:hypothetical protein